MFDLRGGRERTERERVEGEKGGREGLKGGRLVGVGEEGGGMRGE